MAITDWPEDERPREKMLKKGAKALSDSELLAIFLRVGVKGKSAVELARQILQHFGGLRAALEAGPDQLSTIPGMGNAKWAQLQACLELGSRYLEATLSQPQAINSSSAARQYVSSRLRAYPHEVFACLFLDNQHRLIAFEELFRGTISSAAVYPREVVKRALALNAAAVILAHNHPSGVAEPSQSDRQITDQLKQALFTVDVRIVDHFVVGDGDVVSMAERGWL